MAKDGLTRSERSTYQALRARGVSHEGALQDALDGVEVETVREWAAAGRDGATDARIDGTQPSAHEVAALDRAAHPEDYHDGAPATAERPTNEWVRQVRKDATSPYAHPLHALLNQHIVTLCDTLLATRRDRDDSEAARGRWLQAWHASDIKRSTAEHRLAEAEALVCEYERRFAEVNSIGERGDLIAERDKWRNRAEKAEQERDAALESARKLFVNGRDLRIRAEKAEQRLTAVREAYDAAQADHNDEPCPFEDRIGAVLYGPAGGASE